MKIYQEYCEIRRDFYIKKGFVQRLPLDTVSVILCEFSDSMIPDAFFSIVLEMALIPLLFYSHIYAIGWCVSLLSFFLGNIDEVLSENFLDYKNRGVNGSHRGQIIWKIDASSYFVEREYFSHSCRPGWSRIQLLCSLYCCIACT